MTISVLISVYKFESGSRFTRAMESIWDTQILKPDKIILVEDGELTDELYCEIELWKQKLKDKLLILKNKENIGLTKSLNKGIQHIQTDLIARMDCDDISTPERFKLQHDFLVQNKDIAIVGGSLQEFDENNKNLSHRKYPTDPKLIKQYICKASPLAHPTVMMRTSIFSELKYNEKYKTSQDISLWFDVLAKGYKISNLTQTTLFFNKSEDMLKRRTRKKAINEFKIYISGIRKLYGLFNLKYIYPIMRLIFRLSPQCVIKLIYNSSFRTILLNKF